MQTVSIIASPSAPHQVAHAYAMKSGLGRIGVRAEIVSRPYEAAVSPIVACWGWRNGKQLQSAGKQVLVMERGYLGDRFSWTSLGWNGLNRRALMPELDDGGARFRRYHGNLLGDRDGKGDYVLLIGQVPGDAALNGKDLAPWYRDTLHKSEHIYQLPVRFRPHPRARAGAYPKEIRQHNGELSEAIAGARAVVTYNSNTAVEAVIAGKSAVAMDEGSMAWDVTSHLLGSDYSGDRMNWAHRLAWKQWQLKEIEDGSALSHVWRLL